MLNLNKEIVEKLKSAFSVEGSPLIKSDKFSDELIAQLKLNSKAHSSHWSHLGKNCKTWTDEEIWEQYLVFINLKDIPKQKLDKEIASIYKMFDYKDEKSDKKIFIEKINKLFGINGNKIFDTKFWINFGSAPFTIKGTNNEDLINANKKFGTVGMNEIFKNGEFSKYDTIGNYSSIIYSFTDRWNEKKTIYDLKNIKSLSLYRDLNDIEENVVVKNIKKQAEKYYLDKSKPFEERIKVFHAHGHKEPYIFEPVDETLKTIFDVYLEKDYLERHCVMHTVDIIHDWIYILSKNRIKINWANKYHPALIKTKRNYTPSKEAIERLKYFYMSKLFLEGVSSFEFDW